MTLNNTNGIVLNAGDYPLITRAYDTFSSGTYSGLGRWGMFLSGGYLTMGFPKTASKYFEVASFGADSTKTSLMTIANDGATVHNGSVQVQSSLKIVGTSANDGMLHIQGTGGSTNTVGISLWSWIARPGGAPVQFLAVDSDYSAYAVIKVAAVGNQGNNTPVEALRVTATNVSPSVTFSPMSDNAIACGTSSNRWTSVYAANGVIQTSDERQKTDLRPIPNALEIIKSATPYDYQPKYDSKRHFGFTAQQLVAALAACGVDASKYALVEGDDDRGYMVNYSMVVPILCGAVQDLSSQVRDLSSQVNMDAVNKTLQPLLHVADNHVVRTALKLVVVLYLSVIAPVVPANVKPILDSIPVRIALLSLVGYYSTHDPILSILLALSFYVGMNVIQGKAAFEKFQQIPIVPW
ncbi:hypothetical protein GGF32_007074 [Allomyces javanicus]|nr:hypothetical protein GGF32_007074 [Allomyces javanicus]